MYRDVLNTIILGNTVYSYIICILIFIVSLIVLYIFKNVLIRQLEKWAVKTKTTVDDFLIKALKNKLLPVFYFVAFYIAVNSLKLNPAADKAIDLIAVVILTIFGIRFLLAVIIFGLETYWLKREKDKDKTQAIKGILTVIRLIVWGLAIIVLLDNIGIKISTLVAGLGIGGVAIALAAQAILGDLFSYFTIFFDRPFEIGDFIIVGEYMGVVEHIGIKTTRIRSLGGEELIFSNTDLTGSRVRNYKRMEKRRVVFKLGVIYQTEQQQLKEIPGIIKSIIEGIEKTVFDRAHFFSYGDFSLIFEIVYYVMGSDYNTYMDIQQEINFRIREEFDKRDIEFAYPTQTIFMEKP